MENGITDALIELASSELIEIGGGEFNIWRGLGYALSWLTDVDYRASETLMNHI